MIYYLERLREGTVNQDAGAFGRDGFKSLRKTGCCPETIWPYDINEFTVKPSEQAYADSGWGKIHEYDHPINEASQMNAIFNGCGVAFGFTVPACFEGEECMNTGVMPEPQENENILGGHEVVRMGWKPGYWECRNSWGSGVMDNGYFWMPKGFGNSGWCSDYRAITS
jgi:C1A family cysteine protease